MTHPDTTPQSAEADDFRLGYGVVPRRYELRLAPDLASATFSGTETIEIEILEPVGAIVMNALELEIGEASLALGWASAGDDVGPAESFSLGVEMDVEAERVAFSAPSEDVPPGRYSLSCSFTGELNDKLCGFYRSVYFDESGVEHVIATTQFEDTDARRAFPCFDEPDRKAVFSVTLDAPAGMLAVSNGPEVSSEELPGGARRVRFGDTIPMSTYLVACIVGPLEATDAVDVGGVALRVVHQPGKAGLTAPALDAARHALGFFTEYFGIAYPGTKLDLVAIPDFAAGAMENLGCVTFRDAALLADPERTSRVEMERITEVVEHELAHMWFGDLVTMRWWNGIWLNEAFATFMALCCQDDYRPEWKVFTAFARDRSTALGVDGLHATRPIEYPVRSPDEATAMFDVLTYEKGATILWMLERYLGRESFRDGVRRYLAAHSYANTETHDLWDAIATVAGDVPIREIMDSWIFQGGFPLVTASARVGADGVAGVELSQTPFSYLPEPLPWPGDADHEGHSAVGSSWVVPVLVAPAGGGDTSRLLLTTTPVQLAEESDGIVVNAGGAGFYRLSYDASLRSALLARYESLRPIERYNVVSDSWAVCLADRAPLASAFELFERVAAETDPYVWSVVTGALGLVDLLAPDELRERVAAFTRDLLAPQLARVGWDAATGEDEKDRLLRATLISALGTFGRDAAVTERAHAAFVADHDGTSQVPPDIATAVLGVVAHHAGQAELDAILERYRRPLDPIDEARHVAALGRLGDVELAARVHRLTLSEIRSQNAPYVLASMLSVRAIGPATWQHIASSLDQMLERFPANSIHRMLEGIPALAQVDESGAAVHADQVRSVVGAKIVGGRRRLVAQSLERLEVNVRLARRLPKELGDALPR